MAMKMRAKHIWKRKGKNRHGMGKEQRGRNGGGHISEMSGRINVHLVPNRGSNNVKSSCTGGLTT